MRLASHILALTTSTNAIRPTSYSTTYTTTTTTEINYQTAGYCGVPVHSYNADIFDNLPMRSFSGAHDNRENRPTKDDERQSNNGHWNFGMRPQGQPGGNYGMGPTAGFRISSKEQAYNNMQKLSNYAGDEDAQPTDKPKTTQSTSKQPATNAYQNEDSPTVFNFNDHMRIMGGKASVPHSWPWQAHLSVCGKWKGVFECNVCGGSIISPSYVITAAHCIPINPTGSVILGAHSLSQGGVQRIAVSRFKAHPSWNTPTMFDYDIAVLQLAEKIIFTDEVSPICLPQKDVCFTEGTPCVVTGWGLLQEPKTNEPQGHPDDLQEVAVKLIDRERCRKYKGYEHVTDRMTCAGYEAGGRDACGGDSGGPLVCRNGSDGPWVLYGIVSWGYGCARPGNPGVYASLPALVDWVKQNTGLEPTIKMNKCYDGAMSTKEPMLTPRPTPSTSAADSHRESDDIFDCENPLGYGQTQSGSGIFKSDNYPGTYKNNQHCKFCVAPDVEGSYIELEIKNLQLDQKKNCHRKGDYLFVEQEEGDGYYLCQVKPKDSHRIISSRRVCLRFVTNGEKARSGLLARFAQIKSPPSGCGSDQNINLREDSREVIKSMNFPDKYQDRRKASCSWLVKVDDALSVTGQFKIELDFNVFQMAKPVKGKKIFCADSDRLIIYGSASCEPAILERAPILYELCGHYKPKDRPLISISSQSACIVFEINGDSSKNGSGFNTNVNLIKRTYG